MKRTFIEVPLFTKKWKELGLTDEDLRDLQNILLQNPKSGGSRVIYVDIEIKEVIYFINVYTKNEKDDLTEDEKKAFKAVVKMLKEE